MARGRSIRIYLEGGEVSGIRHAELVNWTGQALLCPRNRIAQLAEWESVARRPGVYFLVGAERTSSREVYIGEAESVLGRLKGHIDKEFWHEVIIFTSKDEHLTKSHVKYLEARLVERARAAGRYSVLNSNQPTQSGLPRSDRDAMEEVLDNLPLLLGVLGHRVLDPLATVVDAAKVGGFTYVVKEARARGAQTDEGFVVFKGSTALKQVTESMSAPGYIALKKELITVGKLALKGDVYEFVEDVLFDSPSAAAAVVYGNAANGRIAWKSADGRTLKEVEEAEVDAE
jgi:hypothetical protein